MLSISILLIKDEKDRDIRIPLKPSQTNAIHINSIEQGGKTHRHTNSTKTITGKRYPYQY